MENAPDQHLSGSPSERGFFRSWRRVYVAVLLTTLAVYLLLFWFSRTFGGS